ncbi:MAG: hypothetical protein PVJ03_08615 [Chromatiaceae bacterium]
MTEPIPFAERSGFRFRRLGTTYLTPGKKADMDSFEGCPIDFLCCAETCIWAGWAFVAWMVVMVIAGAIGIFFRERRRTRAGDDVGQH